MAAVFLTSSLCHSLTAQRGSITGHAFCEDTKKPCRFAAIIAEQITTTGSSSQTSSTVADLDGAFVLTSLPPGQYRVFGELSGYLSPTSLYSPAELASPSTAATPELDTLFPTITVSADATTDIQVVLRRGATLSGVVRYDDGSGAGNLNIRILKKAGTGEWQNAAISSSGLFSSMGGTTTNTDDGGTYRVAGLPAGEYTVEVALPTALMSPSSLSQSAHLNVKVATGAALRTYYGNAHSLKAARSVELSSTAMRGDVDVVIDTTTLHQACGTVLRRNTHQPYEGSLRLQSSGEPAIASRDTTTNSDGTFCFQYLPSGKYTIESAGKAARQQLLFTFQLDRDIGDLAGEL